MHTKMALCTEPICVAQKISTDSVFQCPTEKKLNEKLEKMKRGLIHRLDKEEIMEPYAFVRKGVGSG